MFIFNAEDLIKGTRINSFYKEYSAYTGMDHNRIEQIREFKLDKLIRHLWNHVPYYHYILNGAGYNPGMPFTLRDLKSLPILTRNHIQEDRSKLLWKEYSGKKFKGSSSGTTGIPINYFQDLNGMSSGVAAAHILMGFSGWRPGMRSVHIWGNIESVKQWNKLSSRIKQKINSRKNISSSLFNNPHELADVVTDIQHYKPEVVDGYTNSIYELALFLKRNNMRLPSVKIVFTTAENLEEHYIETIQEAIAPVSDLYGCGEINGVACRPVNDDKYYIFDPHVVVETAENEEGDMKEILVTDLNNYLMPLVRYRIGDLIDNVYPAVGGAKLPFSYFKKVYGRTADHIKLPDGKKIFPVNIFGGTLYRKYSAVKRHKTTWNGDKLVFWFEINGEINLDALKNDIESSMKDYDLSYEIHTTDKLPPSKNGKFRYFERI
jgi:phenylacetate-CoA ligase